MMKNELTTEEWLIINNYLQFGITTFHCSKDIETFKSAKKKIKKTSEKIKKHEH